MAISISDDFLRGKKIDERILRSEIAIYLFANFHFTLGEAASFCDMAQIEFQKVLSARQIPIHYDIEEFEKDLKVIEERKTDYNK